jgi:hypothetical protein
LSGRHVGCNGGGRFRRDNPGVRNGVCTTREGEAAAAPTGMGTPAGRVDAADGTRGAAVGVVVVAVVIGSRSDAVPFSASVHCSCWRRATHRRTTQSKPRWWSPTLISRRCTGGVRHATDNPKEVQRTTCTTSQHVLEADYPCGTCCCFGPWSYTLWAFHEGAGKGLGFGLGIPLQPERVVRCPRGPHKHHLQRCRVVQQVGLASAALARAPPLGWPP